MLRNVGALVSAAQEHLVRWLNEHRRDAYGRRMGRLVKSLREAPRLAFGTQAECALWVKSAKFINRQLRDALVRLQLEGVTNRGAAHFSWHSENQVGVAVIHLVTLAQEGLLERVRGCPQCGRWLFARKADQKYCSDRCRAEAHQQERKTPEYRAYWRDYMKGYRGYSYRKAGRSQR